MECSSSSSSPSMNDKTHVDIYEWLHNLPPLHQWKHNSISIPICSSPPSSHLTITISKTSSSSSSSSLSLSLVANLSTLPISLWSSKPFKVGPTSQTLISPQSTQTLLLNTIQDILNYGNYNYCNPTQLPSTLTATNYTLKQVFNLSLLTLSFLVTVYEAPLDLRSYCLVILKDRLSTLYSREAYRHLTRAIGATLEERWNRSVNLAITNWLAVTNDSQTTGMLIKCPSPMFSHSTSEFGMWKLQVYCPVAAMEVEGSSGGAGDDKVMFSLKYHQLEGVVQLNYKVVVTDKWVDVMVSIDNIR